ncbi:MAG TPA: hypothetical protein DDZ88_05960 [Verrucomicrobiales bacterium]|nr:hypothetical protein [Verrucomicrobiales bacterium]
MILHITSLMSKSHASTITHVIGWCLCKAVFAVGIVLFTGCATKPTQSSNETSLPSWVQQNRLSEATETEVETAKSSEVTWINGRADLGSGLSLKLHRGEILGTGQLSTTSHYSLNDSKGRSLVKLPSRLSNQDTNPEQNETKIWASQDQELFLVYESRRDATGDREFHGVIYKSLDGRWEARGVVLPRWNDTSEAVRQAKRDGVPGNPVFHEGPFSVGVINGAIILLPVNGKFFSVKPDDLKSFHPFPFDIG